jgi:hypothetical protein
MKGICFFCTAPRCLGRSKNPNLKRSNSSDANHNEGTSISVRTNRRYRRSVDRARKGRPAAGEFLARHGSGDWGELDEHDRKENQLSLERGFRLLSSYFTNAQEKIWLITEADRSATTLLLPDEY